MGVPIGIEPAGRNPGEIESRGAIAAQAGEILLRGGDLVARNGQVAASVMGQAAADDGVAKPAPRGHPDALAVEKGALAALGDKKLVVGRIVDERGDDGAVALERDRDREMRNAVQEIGGAVERIDDPAVALVGAGGGAAFLAEKAVIPPRLGEFLA